MRASPGGLVTAAAWARWRVAETPRMSHHTAAGYMKGMYEKLQVNGRAEAALKAIHMGLVNPG